MPWVKTASLTAIALVAFAANSLLCRAALAEASIDPLSFTSIRLGSGCALLVMVVLLRGSAAGKVRDLRLRSPRQWLMAAMLLVYAITFSYAYVQLNAATGALLLFGSVQLTMLLIAALRGEPIQHFEWLGILVAFAGVAYLLLPGAQAPDLIGGILMIAAGVAWGFYTLAGGSSKAPLLDTTRSFLWALPLAGGLMALSPDSARISTQGVILAVISGALASGLGYVIWYAALAGLRTSQAAVVQLLVPVIAALGGVILLSEALSSRLLLAGSMTLGGILLVVLLRRPAERFRE